ncbi:hypothetical protein F5Y16DRAFT_395019 [Xylariaceae sp. FL0255]|nr:hypothetical protein F5Y16DRAFT_395019 [Xylariaceae sp. FL0255]
MSPIPPVSAGDNAPSPSFAMPPRQSRSRAASLSSDRPSTIGIHNLMSPPLPISPEAAFIAASAASQIVTSDHDSHSQTWYDEVGIDPSGDTVMISNGALQLANNFVDQLLFNVLAVAKSTALSALRAAVVDVLKPKLAKDAINVADEELREYLGGVEMEDLVKTESPSSSKDWDLELVWKRTRLRCMVYSSLGDMEEEDEDHYMEQEHLNGESDDTLSEAVSPAVAIFLTSILEFTGEQILVVAGQAAFHRLRSKYEKELKEQSQPTAIVSERIVVEDLDMERVALDRTFGRLWRAWKKRIRSPTEPNFSRPFSRSSAYSSGVSFHKHDSATMMASQELGTTTESQESQSVENQSEPVQETAEEDSTNVDPATLPLPDSDVEAAYSDQEESEDGDDSPRRPQSWIVFPTVAEPEKDRVADQNNLRRALSLPSRKRPHRSLFSTVPDQSEVADEPPEGEGFQEADTQPAEEQEEQVGNASTEKAKAVTKDNVSEVVAERSSEAEPKIEDTEEPTGLIEKVTSGAVAVGAAAVAGLATLATGIAPQTQVEEDESDEVDDQSVYSEAEDVGEEPEIMNVSRVSVDRRSSPAISDQGRPTSVIHTRASSIKSIRVIDVPGPRSPSMRSRSGSVEAETPHVVVQSHPSSHSREGSESRTPPIAEEQVAYVTSPGAAPSVTAPAVVTPSVTVTNVVQDAVPYHTDETQNPKSTGAAPAPIAPTSSPIQPIAPSYTTGLTKAEALNSYATRASEERHDSVSRSTSVGKNPPMPTLPERSTSRPTYVQTNVLPRASPVSPDSPKFTTRPVQSESPSSARFKPIRTSEDNGSTRPADVARNFEELIQSNETLQYTLTPENMRNIDSPTGRNGSPTISHTARRSDDARIVERPRSSSIKRTVSLSKSTGLNSHPTVEAPINGKFGNMSSKAGPPVSMRNRTGLAPVARDARVPRESTQDFAEFIRSTGPPGTNGPRPNRTFTGGSGSMAPPAPPRAISSEVRRAPRLQARDATVNTSNESSELIDFIRRGPPNNSSVNHRIPRTVAPFRNTQDSEYMTSAVGGRAIDAVIPNVRSSQTSTNITESSAPSSMNSQSALLNKSNKQQQYTNNSFDDDDLMPKRTRRRIRDPYAIDFSDEEEDDFDVAPLPAPPAPSKKEESLMDFLNNYPPPPEPTPQPFVLPKKKSAPNLITRLRSGSATGSTSSGHGRKGSLLSDSRSLNSRGGRRSNHTPIVVPSSMGGYGSGHTSSVASRAVPSSHAHSSRVEARESISYNTPTSDLAKFLRESQPPPSPRAIAPPVEDKSGSGFSRMFERRKKSTAY